MLLILLLIVLAVMMIGVLLYFSIKESTSPNDADESESEGSDYTMRVQDITSVSVEDVVAKKEDVVQSESGAELFDVIETDDNTVSILSQKSKTTHLITLPHLISNYYQVVFDCEESDDDEDERQYSDSDDDDDGEEILSQDEGGSDEERDSDNSAHGGQPYMLPTVLPAAEVLSEQRKKKPKIKKPGRKKTTSIHLT